MVQNNNDQVVLITGTSSGFGLNTSIALAKEGFRVMATMRNLERSYELLQLAEQYGIADNLYLMTLDVTDEQQVEETVKHIIEKYGHVDILINNAGFAQGGFIEETPLQKWREQFDTNFFGLVKLTQAVLPIMRERRTGKIINISSISGQIAFPGFGPYASSKFAVEAFSEALRLEMLPFGIYVSLVQPGSYKTQIWDKGLQSAKRESSFYQAEMQTILKMIEKTAHTAGNPNEVVETILRVVKSPAPKLRYPVGKGVATSILLKKLLPWSWFEKNVLKRFHRI